MEGKNGLIAVFLVISLVASIGGIIAYPPMVVASNGDPTVDIEDATISNIGATAVVNITLDEAPNGLAGYNMTILLSNPNIAEIVSVEFPGWATLHSNSTLPDDSFWMKAADLMYQVQAGATNINLAKLTIRGDVQGGCEVNATVTMMTADGGGNMLPGLTVDPGDLTVEGEAPRTTVTPSVPYEYDNVTFWTDKEVVLSFRRTDPDSTGVNYTNLSLEPSSVTSVLNVTINNNSWAWKTNLSVGKNTTVAVNGTLGEYFNVTIDEECNATIMYYSVDNGNNVERSKNLTVRIDTKGPVVTTVDLNTTTPTVSESILVIVNATDALSGVANVTADGVELVPQGNNIWDGTIIAQLGYNIVNVSATDAAGNYGYNESASYIGNPEVVYGVDLTVAGVKYKEESAVVNENATYMLTVKNIGNTKDTFNLGIEKPANATAELSKNVTKTLSAGESEAILMNVSSGVKGEYIVNVTTTSQGNPSVSDKVTTRTIVTQEPFDFDTGSGTYPGIFGTHKGTIRPSHDVFVNEMYTYPCAGTGGHTEYVRIWNNNSGLDVNASWKGYVGDWHNISFSPSFTLLANETYNYTIITGSYPQIRHTDALPTANGWINCTQFTDANEKIYYDWIPAVKFF